MVCYSYLLFIFRRISVINLIYVYFNLYKKVFKLYFCLYLLFLGDIILQIDKFCFICNEEYCRNFVYYLIKYNFQNLNDNLGYENVWLQFLIFYQVSQYMYVSLYDQKQF